MRNRLSNIDDKVTKNKIINKQRINKNYVRIKKLFFNLT